MDIITSKDGTSIYYKDVRQNPLCLHKTDAMSQGSTVTLTIDDEPAEMTVASLQRLRSAVVELSIALNETLRAQRSDAAASLLRAKPMLQARSGTTPQITENGARKGLAPWQVRRVLSHIEASLDTQIRNKDLAAIARLSLFHFNVAFRNSVGEAPHGYIIRRRMERAQGLMLSTEKSLSEIAIECGLADQPHLTRLFRRVVGESPAAWRRARVNPAGVGDGQIGRVMLARSSPTEA